VTSEILTGLAVTAGYVLFCLARPYGKCWRCLGKRHLKHGNAVTRNGRVLRPPRIRKCWVCRGKGYAPTPGAPVVHGFFWAAFGDQIRARRQQRNADLRESRKDL